MPVNKFLKNISPCKAIEKNYRKYVVTDYLNTYTKLIIL